MLKRDDGPVADRDEASCRMVGIAGAKPVLRHKARRLVGVNRAPDFKMTAGRADQTTYGLQGFGLRLSAYLDTSWLRCRCRNAREQTNRAKHVRLSNFEGYIRWNAFGDALSCGP